MLVIGMWVLRAVIVQLMADFKGHVAQEVHPTAPPPPEPFVQRPIPHMSPPEREQQPFRAPPENAPRDAAAEQNESDFPK
eukprot:11572387-Alexandrium_andersonii.AAC.1